MYVIVRYFRSMMVWYVQVGERERLLLHEVLPSGDEVCGRYPEGSSERPPESLSGVETLRCVSRLPDWSADRDVSLSLVHM